MRFVHYTDIPIVHVFDRGQQKEYNLKPSGLWISDEEDYGWAEWCQRNAPDFIGKIQYEVELEPKANILWLKTPEDIDAFSYCYNKHMNTPLQNDDHVLAIDWYQLAKEYDGIIITPYQWERRLGCPCVWYYCWDVASGCIWNAKAIKNFEEIRC